MIIGNAVLRASRGTEWQSLMIVSAVHSSSHSICIIKIFSFWTINVVLSSNVLIWYRQVRKTAKLVKRFMSLLYHLTEKSSKSRLRVNKLNETPAWVGELLIKQIITSFKCYAIDSCSDNGKCMVIHANKDQRIYLVWLPSDCILYIITSFKWPWIQNMPSLPYKRSLW